MTDDRFIVTEHGERTERRLADDDDRRNALAAHFAPSIVRTFEAAVRSRHQDG